MKALAIIFFAVIASLSLASCHQEGFTVRTERGDTVYAVPASHQPVKLSVGQSVTIYTTSFDQFIIAGQHVATKSELVDGHTVYTMQAVIIK